MWVIDNFSARIESDRVGDKITSPEFTAIVANAKHEWKFSLYSKGQDDTCEDYLSIFLGNTGSTDFTADVTFGILNNKNETVLTHSTGETTFKRSSVLSSCSCWGFKQYVRRDYVVDEENGLLDNGKLTIICDITFNPSEDKEIASTADKATREELERNSLRLREFDKFQYLIYNHNSFSDVKILVEDETVNAHKCILAKSSPVFLAMFNSEMKEKQESTLVIEDIKYDIFMLMLRYMYAGKVNYIDIAIGDQLLAAADKYLMEGLKFMCGRALCDILSVGNAVECLKIADRYQVEYLKAKAVEFIVSHAADFVNKPEFKLLTEVPDVLFQVCRAMGNKRK